MFVFIDKLYIFIIIYQFFDEIKIIIIINRASPSGLIKIIIRLLIKIIIN